MHLHTRNVNSGFCEVVRMMSTTWHGKVRDQDSRNGKVMMVDEPVTITYSHPRERVLFNSARDANPFFHLYESLYMLAGRNDVAPLVYYCKQYKEYSDDYREDADGIHGQLNGAYGYRWRCAAGRPNLWMEDNRKEGGQLVRGYDRPGVDQLDLLIRHLKENPTSRRAVLNMWNVESDLLNLGTSLLCSRCEGAGFLFRVEEGTNNVVGKEACKPCHGTGYIASKPSKDVCCNLNVMFSLQEDSPVTQAGGRFPDMLHMTVINRSNDLVWGMLGANYVQFTMLQEYVACCLGAQVGLYHHITNNLHAYEWNWKPEEWLSEYSPPLSFSPNGYYEGGNLRLTRLVDNPKVFNRELVRFVQLNMAHANRMELDTAKERQWSEPFLRNVAQPMCSAWHMHKIRSYDAADYYLDKVVADDWRMAGKMWMAKRRKKSEEKEAVKG
jgi:thymidylate synthase